MPYPIISMKLPNGITAPMNGKLFPTQLAPINLPGLGMGTLHPLAVQAFNCLFLIAQIETGQTMTATSNADDYRDYSMQERLFRSRYTPNFDAKRCISKTTGKLWKTTNGGDGRFWYQLKNTSMAAVPGTSNHGFGLAVDCALWVSSSVKSLTSNGLFHAWLCMPNLAPPQYRIGTGSNVESFGLSWEVQSEPWHIRYAVGNVIPQRVRDIMNFLGAPLVTG